MSSYHSFYKTHVFFSNNWKKSLTTYFWPLSNPLSPKNEVRKSFDNSGKWLEPSSFRGKTWKMRSIRDYWAKMHQTWWKLSSLVAFHVAMIIWWYFPLFIDFWRRFWGGRGYGLRYKSKVFVFFLSFGNSNLLKTQRKRVFRKELNLSFHNH